MGKLNIQGDLDIYNYLTATNTNLYLSAVADYSIRFRIGTTEVARINPSGCLCINTTSNTDAYKLYVDGASLFSSSAYFRSNIWANNSAIGGSIAFLPTRSTDNNATGLINYYACGSSSATSYNLGSFYFTQYSYASGTYNRVEYYDRYNLPAVAANKTSNNTYSILTTKNTITVAQGGTGRSSLTSGYALVGNGTNAVSLREITSTATSGSTALITSGGAYNIASQAITDITRSGTTFTATKIDGTTFTFTQQDNNTYGRTANTTSKIFLMGGTSQSASNKTTYSNVDCYASGGYLYSGSTKVSVEGHTHSYLPLSGGTITGSVTFSKSNNYYDIATGTGGSILLNNGDIAGVNSIYFKDAANSVGEGLMFYRSATTVDALRAYNGVLYFSPNYDSAAGTQDGNYTVVHSGNYTNYQVNTDTKVQQSRSTSTNWRPLLSHYTATSQGTNPEAATNICYYNEKASIQPSTGKIYSAGGFIGNASSASSVPWSGITGKPSSYTPSSHTHSYLVSGGTASGSSHAAALKTWFTNNKASIPRNGLLNYYSSAYGNGSQYMGYFLSGYDSNPYGGFFVAHYQDPYYVGISNGNFVQQNIITSTNYSGYAVPLSGGTMSGGLAIVNHTQNNSYDALLFVSHHSTNEWGITIDKGGSYDYGLYINCGQGNYGLSLNGGLLLYSGVGYGSSFPSNPVTGRIFFKI